MKKNSAQGYCDAIHLETTGRANQPYWIGMMKLAAADWSMAAADVACQLERSLVARTGGVLGRDADSRVVLGLTV